MHRLDLQTIAITKLEDAELLFQHQRYSNAYYLFGYAAEIAIKARMAKFFLADTIPDRKIVNDIYTHDLTRLVGLAGLTIELNEEKRRSREFNAYWATVADWSESSRYAMVDGFGAMALRDAMINSDNGVFQWLQKHW